MEGMFDGLVEGIVSLIIGAFIIGAIIVGGIWFFTDSDTIKSKHPIQPTIELTTDGKTVDTIYVYKKP